MKHDFRSALSAGAIAAQNTQRKEQVAALCYRETNKGKRVLLITSRDTGRWIIPKGWQMKGRSDAEAALQEAWEEAGVKDAKVTPTPIGTYKYLKGLKDGSSVPIKTRVFAAQVTSMSETFPEVKQRIRKWFSPAQAARLVAEPELKALLRAV